MSYGLAPYAGSLYGGPAGEDVTGTNDAPVLAVEVAFTTAPLAEPVWVDVTADVRRWDTYRGRNRELERFQPGRATIVLSNREGQYDSHNASGPHFGYLKPMRRIRIRETFDGVTYPLFDGFVDRWLPEYPNAGLDATCTVTATDGFKVWARKKVGRSVYANEVQADAPSIWWHLDDGVDVAEGGENAVNDGLLGSAAAGIAFGYPKFKAQGLVVKDPGSSMEPFQAPDFLSNGVYADSGAFDLANESAWSVEAWARTRADAPDTASANWVWGVSRAADAAGIAVVGFKDDTGSDPYAFQFLVANSGASVYGVKTPDNFVEAGKIYHLVATKAADGTLTLWVNGTAYTAAATGTSGAVFSGSMSTGRNFSAGGSLADNHQSTFNNWEGEIDEVAAYDYVLSADQVAAHYAAGTAPWAGDSPSDRIGRVLDAIGWPTDRRSLDTGIQPLQSADINGQSALEHMQKVGETDFGLFFADREGSARFADLETLFSREPYDVAFGDEPGDIGYRSITFDDGDTVIRNRATISRLGGQAALDVSDLSVEDYGPFDYVLEGLLHSSDIYSENYANLVVSEYKDPHRRVVGLTCGTPPVGEEATAWPGILGREIGEAITVRQTPLGADQFEQTCAIEALADSWDALTTDRLRTFTLSPEFAIRELEEEDVALLGYAKRTPTQSGISAEVDITGMSVTCTVGSGRLIRVRGHVQINKDANAGTALGFVHEDGVSAGRWCVENMSAGGFHLADGAVLLTPSAGSHTYKLTISVFGAGTLDLSNADASWITVEDIGAA